MEGRILKSYKINGLTFEVVLGDLLKEKTDVIVNAADSYLKHGGGIALKIKNKAGSKLEEEGNEIVKKLGPIKTGSAVITTAGNLPFKGVIHVVGPVFGEGDEEEKLKNGLKEAFLIASDKKFSSLSFPAVSSGIFAVPLDICAKSYLQAVLEFSKENPKSTLKLIRLVLFTKEIFEKIDDEISKII